jgi:hypothetical protein
MSKSGIKYRFIYFRNKSANQLTWKIHEKGCFPS